ncbi:methylmalonyl-CoA mutase family protein [Metabacillus sp. GX 13764]|uniref:methylmalonyl-CoA mutase family protein n=1 Tax=Metabacillus kandeliae TaxID=2900151 RepID=UPI001E3E5BE6|nr:methylmalonyl-CoA mutase family protein [Metabacillus kandeliae]MCD7033233.1 methylmalonyl-CoA mutase family protein [Metabacillus kandeliae]
METKQNAGKPFSEITEKDWQREVEKALRGKPFESLYTETAEQILLKPLYTWENTEHQPLPGEYPFVRGAKTEAGWKVSQLFTDFSSPEELNERILDACKKGQNSVFIKDFSKLNKKEHWEKALFNVPSETLHFVLDYGSNPAAAASFAKFAEEGDAFKGEGIIGFDPFEGLLRGEQSAAGTEHAIAFLFDYASWCTDRLPHVKTIYIKGESFHEAGANAVQELAYTFAKSLDLLHAAKEDGRLSSIADKFAFEFKTGPDYFMEISKLRAARLIWSTIIPLFSDQEDARKLTIHAETAQINQSRLDYHMNLLRAASESFSAAAGGADSLHISPFNEMDGAFHNLSDRIARNTHHLLNEESFLTKVADPAGGSWYVEALTIELAEKAWQEIQKIENMGGFTKAVLTGHIQEEIEKAYDQKEDALHYRKLEMIGTNIYCSLSDAILPLDRKENRQPLSKNLSFAEALSGEVEEAAIAGSGVKPLVPRRLSETFEKLRIKALSFKQKNGVFPVCSILAAGELKDYKPRLDFVQGLLAAGGIEPLMLETGSDACGGPVIVCGSDAAYEEGTGDIQELAKNCSSIWIAGKQPQDKMDALSAEGCLYQGMNIYAFLEELQKRLGAAE